VSTTGTRTLVLLSLLQTRRHWGGAELATRLDISARTLRRDVDRLRELGYPVEAQRGVDGGYYLAPGAVLPPLVLDDDEAVALGVGLQSAIQGGTVLGIEEASVRALAKIVQVLPAPLRRRVDALAAMTVPAEFGTASPSVDAGVLTSLALACRDNECVGFAYTARNQHQTERIVEPHRLVLLWRRWYLVGWDQERLDWRSFRLDRITGPRTLGTHVVPRALPHGDAAEFVRSGIDSIQTRHCVEVEVFASVAEVEMKVGTWGEVESQPNNRCLLKMNTDSLDWPLLAVGSIGAEFRVIEPPALRQLVEEWNGRFTRAVEREDP
jgi:predicted DNA-binding transcriptional regulator YafY